MTALVIAFAAAALLSAALTTWAEASGRRGIYLVGKPLTMALVIAAALAAGTPVPPAYKTFVVAGLLCSLAGDVALMFPEKWFTAGLAAFLTAHLFYILAFRPRPGHAVGAGVLLPFVVFGLLMFRVLAPTLGRMKIPVLVYVAAITAMASLAAGRFVDLGGTRTLLAFAGAALFLVSDSVLAYDRFVRRFGPARAVVLGTYFPAQILIALSI